MIKILISLNLFFLNHKNSYKIIFKSQIKCGTKKTKKTSKVIKYLKSNFFNFL